MLKIQHLLRRANVQEEREFERDNVAKKAARYLETNPLDRYASDVNYRIKVDRIRAGLQGIGGGYILDIGGNTAGEATVLTQRGLDFVVGDINQLALDVSRRRVERFGLKRPDYVALDVHRLPFADESFGAVTVIEAMHHFVDYGQALREIHRVLKPGGKLFSLEPNARNPLRRLSEVRDRFRGTIEKSFHAGQLSRLCRTARFSRVSVETVPVGKSTWKMAEVPRYRRSVALLHGWLSTNWLPVFGGLQLECYKEGSVDDSGATLLPLPALLRNPLNGDGMAFDPSLGRWVDSSRLYSFPDLNGIPVMVPDDAVQL